MPSNSNRRVTFTIDVQAQLGDLKNQVDKMQKVLSGLSMPENLTQSTKNSINDLFERIKKVQQYTEGNEMKLVDEKKVQEELNAIRKDFLRVVNQVEGKASKIKIGDTKSFDNLKKALDQYKKGIVQATENYTKQQEAIAETKRQRDKLNSEADKKRQIKKNTEEEIAAQRKVAEEANKIQEKYRNDKAAAGWDPKKIDTNIKKTKAYKDEQAALERISELTTNLTRNDKSLANAERKLSEEGKVYEQTLTNQEADLADLKKKLDEVTSGSFETLKNTLAQMKESGDIDVDFDPKDLKNAEELEQILKDIDSQTFTKVSEAIRNLSDPAKDAAKKVDDLGGSIHKSKEEADNLADTLDGFKSKAAYFFGLGNAVNLFRRGVISAYNTVKDLDEVMTQTAVVTDFSVSDMWSQLPEYTRRANELGVSIHDVYESATLYYQQGLETNEVMALSNETLKMARIANLNAADATSRMTNALRGFNMEINEMNAQRINDVYSKLAAITASDTNEISTAMTKVASLAHNANMEFETTSAFLAQMIETTRESAETAGTALKTVIARFSEVKKLYNQGDLMGTDEEGEEIDVNKVSVALRSAGINMNEYLTGAKGLDDIFIELASKWESLDMIQQRYIATMAAGSRQQSRFIAMMSDYKRTMQLVEAANTSAGASQQQFEKTLDSMKSKLAQLKNSWDTFLMGIANNQIIKLAVDALTSLIDVINKLFDGIDSVSFGIGSLPGRIALVYGALKVGGNVVSHVLEGAYKLIGATDKATKLAEGRKGIKGIFSSITEVFSKQEKAEEGVTEGLKKSAAAADSSAKKFAILGLKVAAVAGIFLGLQYVLKKIKEMSPAGELKRAEEAAQAAADNAQEAAKSFNEINDSIASLKDKHKALEEMTRGSKEWRDAVREINEEVLNLMSTYSDLKITNNNGILRVENEEEVIEKATRSYYASQAAQIGAQARAAQATVEVDKKQLSSEAIASLTDILSRRGIASPTDFNKDLDTARTLDQNIEKIALKYVEGAFSGTKEEIKKQIGNVIGVTAEDISDDFLEDLKALGTEIYNTKEKIENYNNSIAQIAISAASIMEGTEAKVNSFLNSNRMESLFIDEFNELAGKSSIYIKQALIDEGGYSSEQVSKLDAEGRREQLAYIRAQQKATIAVEGFSKKINKLSDTVQKIYSREDLAGLTAKEATSAAGGFNFEAYRKGNEEERLAEAQKLQDAAWKEWEALGPEVQALFGSFADFQTDYVQSVIRSLRDLKDAEEAFSKIGLGDDNPFEDLLSGGAQKDLVKKLEEVFDVSGITGAKIIRDRIAELMEGLDSEQREQFAQALKSIDWKNAVSIEGLSDLLESYGIETDGIDELEKQIIELNNAAKKVDLEKITEQLQKLTSLEAAIRSGDKGFTGYSQEEVDALVGAGMSSEDFVMDPFSGTYTYIHDDLDAILTAIQAQTDALIDSGDLENKIEQGEIVRDLNEKYGNLDRSNVDQYLLEYISKGGTEVSEDTVLANIFDRDKLLELAQGLQVFDINLEDTTQQLYDLQKAQEVQEQILRNSIRENANKNNAEAVMVQARNIGIPEDLLKGKTLEQIAGLGEVFEKATEFDIDFDQLEKYIKELKKAKEELSDVEVAQLALANTRLNRGLQQIIDTYEDWTALITENGIQMEDLDSVSAETVNNFKSSVKELLNMTEDLPDAFFKSEENLRNIQALAEGHTEVISELRAAATESIALEIAPDANTYGEIQDFIDYIANVDPNMEVGAIIDDTKFINGLNKLVEVSGKSAQEIARLFGSVTGFEFEPILEKVPMAKSMFSGFGSGGVSSAAGAGIALGTEMVEIFTGLRPKYVGGPSSSINYAEPSGSGGGGSEKTDTWENPYDELYNLTEKINEALRTREALERRYEKLVKKTGSTMGEVTKAYYDQIRHLRAEAELQKEMQAGRARQIENVGNEMYIDSEGNRSSFSSLGVTKYGSYDMSTGLLQIDWNALEALEGDPSKVEEGKAAEAYISRLEELQDQFEEVRDKLWDIEDQIEELREEAIENYLSFEDRVLDAVINKYQTQIDELSNLYDAIKNATDEIIKGVQEDVALSRQIRDNTKKEEDIANKEARLAYLRRDTSGANALEIKKLEDEIANARESYSDTLVDQQIQDMQNEANAAAEQRQHQIEIMQNQLEVAKKNGELWNEVWNLLNTATAGDGTFSQNSELVMLLEEAEAFQALSVVGQAKWWEEAAEAFKRAQVGLSEAEVKYGVDANADGSVSNPDTSAMLSGGGSSVGSSSGYSSSGSSQSQSEGNRNFSKVGEYEKPKAQMPADEVRYLQQALNDAGFTDANDNTLKTDGIYGPKTMEAVRKLQAAIGAKVDGYFGPETRSKTLSSRFNMYKTGGLADYTGPAWLDGSKTHPELVLNAKDTQNFITLKDTLARLLGGQNTAGGLGGGTTYFNINIEADIGSDYDVTRLAEQIKKEIYNDSAYRNVNVINFSR